MIELDVTGKWWLPHTPERRLSGRLVFDPGHGATLTLDGALRTERDEAEPIVGADGQPVGYSITEDSRERAGTYPRIHGLAGRDRFTLDDCFQTRRSGALFDADGAVEEVYANWTFKGIWFEDGEEASATRLAVRADHLRYWPRRTGLVRDRPGRPTDDGDPWTTIRAYTLPEMRFTSAGGATYGITQEISVGGDGVATQELRQDFAYWFEETSTTSIRDLLTGVSVMLDAATIGLDRATPMRRVTLRHPDVVREVGGRRYPVAIELFARFLGIEEPESTRTLHEHQMLFSLDQLGGIEGLGRWIEAMTPHRSGLTSVVTTATTPMHVSNVLMNRAAALEAFDRVHTSGAKGPFLARIRRLCDLAGDDFAAAVGDTDLWSARLRDLRNQVAHHLGARLDVTTEDEHDVAQAAYLLYVLCALRVSSAPSAAFAQVRASPRHRGLRRSFGSA